MTVDEFPDACSTLTANPRLSVPYNVHLDALAETAGIPNRLCFVTKSCRLLDEHLLRPTLGPGAMLTGEADLLTDLTRCPSPDRISLCLNGEAETPETG